MPRRVLIHPDTACERLGFAPKPNEGFHAKYNRRRHLAKMGLTRYTVRGQKGYRYSAIEVDALAEKNIQAVPKAA